MTAGTTERVAKLEARNDEQMRMANELRESIANLEVRMEGRFEAVDRRFDTIDRRFEAIDRRFEAIDRRFEGVDRRFDAIDRRLEVMDAKISKHFYWMVGLQITTLTAVITALAAR